MTPTIKKIWTALSNEENPLWNVFADIEDPQKITVFSLIEGLWVCLVGAILLVIASPVMFLIWLGSLTIYKKGDRE